MHMKHHVKASVVETHHCAWDVAYTPFALK